MVLSKPSSRLTLGDQAKICLAFEMSGHLSLPNLVTCLDEFFDGVCQLNLSPTIGHGSHESCEDVWIEYVERHDSEIACWSGRFLHHSPHLKAPPVYFVRLRNPILGGILNLLKRDRCISVLPSMFCHEPL